MTISLAPAEELAFYTHHLKTTLIPFWLTRSVDRVYGGFFTCFDNATGQLLAEDKFTWAQGRIVWVWARLAGMNLFAPDERAHFFDLARSGADFLMRHCLLPGDRCAFLMSRTGEHKAQAPGMPLDSSIYADCFVILGLARYAAVSGDRPSLDFARRLYRSVSARLASGQFHTEPYPIPTGYKVHGIPMILLNTAQELAHGLSSHDLTDEAAEVMAAGDAYLAEIKTHFVTADGTLHEMVALDKRSATNSLLDRYVNPGHTIEDMWFWLHQAHASGATKTLLPQIAQIIKRAFEIGWDDEYGGLLLFADQDGGPPRGSAAGLEDERMAQKVLADWGSKLWWVHSEALYTTLLAWRLTGDDELLGLYRRAFDYTFRTFPHPDETIGEWIQIRDRQGRPEQRVVALPVKDPFHVIRNVAQIVDLLAEAVGVKSEGENDSKSPDQD